MLLLKITGFGQWQENPLQRSKAGELVNQIIMIKEWKKIVWSLEDCNPKLGMMQYATIPNHSFVRKMFSIKKKYVSIQLREKCLIFIISPVWSIQLWEKCFLYKELMRIHSVVRKMPYFYNISCLIKMKQMYGCRILKKIKCINPGLINWVWTFLIFLWIIFFQYVDILQ